MKKIVLMFAFAGIVGAASATSLVAMSKSSVVTLGEEKRSDDKKKDEKAKSCDHKEGKEGCAHGSKSCCKAKGGDKGETSKATTEDSKTTTTATSTTEKK